MQQGREEMAWRPSTPPQRHCTTGMSGSSPEETLALFSLTFCLLQISPFYLPHPLHVLWEGREKHLEMLLFQDKGLDWLSCFFIKAWCRTGLEMGLKMISTLPECLWHLLLCGCHLPRVRGEVEGYHFASPAGTGGFTEREGITQMWGGQKQLPGR